MQTIPSPSVPVPVAPRPLERLEAEIVTLATQLTAATARFIALIGEFDAAEGWRDWGMRSTAHWLSWKCGIGMNAGREHVRVARALRGLPLAAERFADGRLSYSKVRALTRFVTSENESDVVTIAETATAAQMETLQAAMRRTRSAQDTRSRHASRFFRYHREDDGSLVGSFRLPPDQAAVFLHGLETATGRIQPMTGEGDDASAETPEPPRRAEATAVADALVAMAEATLQSVSAETSTAGQERFQLVLHATQEFLAAGDDATDDAAAGAELADGTRLHPSTARRLTCNCPTSTMIEDVDGNPLHIGRRHRRIRGRLARAVHARDRGRCRAPGCSEPATQIHHIRHWANGGPTCLPNLISLCDQHHWLVHEGGFTLLTRSPGRWALLGPSGVTVDARPIPPVVDAALPHDPTLRDDAVSGQWDGTTLDVGYVTSLLTQPAPSAAPTTTQNGAADAEGVTFDAETINAFADRLRALHDSGAATHAAHLPEEPDEPYTW